MPGGVEHQQSELLDLQEAVGYVLLHHLVTGEFFAACAAAEHALAHHVEGALDHGHGAHGVVHAAAAQPGLRDGEGLALAAQQVVGGYAHLVVTQVRVATGAQGLPAQAGVAYNLEPLGVAGHEKH